MTLLAVLVCNGCQETEGNDAYALVDQWYEYWNETLVVGRVEAQDLELQGLSATIDDTLSTLGISTDNLNTVSVLINNLTAWQALYTNNVNTLDARVSISSSSRHQTFRFH